MIFYNPCKQSIVKIMLRPIDMHFSKMLLNIPD